jgi:hypothetical protein
MIAGTSSMPRRVPARAAAGGPGRPGRAAKSALDWSARLWVVVAGAGQLVFLFYIAVLYGSAALGGDPAAWNKVMPKGNVPGDTAGNFAVAMHVLLAAVITGGGLIQLVPQLRRNAPALHRWNGRLYVVTAFVISLGGLYMVWVRGSATGGVAISLNAVLIMFFAAMAWRQARMRGFGAHRRWALRLFLASSGVWFIRIGVMGWILVNGRPVGFDPETFTGPFITFWSFASYLLPLAVLELYLRAQERAGNRGQFAMAATLAVLTVATAIGIFAATMGMWLPAL